MKLKFSVQVKFEICMNSGTFFFLQLYRFRLTLLKGSLRMKNGFKIDNFCNLTVGQNFVNSDEIQLLIVFEL